MNSTMAARQEGVKSRKSSLKYANPPSKHNPEASVGNPSSPDFSATSKQQQFLYKSLALDSEMLKENVTVTVRFRPLSPREIRQGEEIAWYPDGETVVRNEHTPSIAYAYGEL